MKKTLFILASLFAFVCIASAQKKEIPKEYKLMKDVSTINYSFDFSPLKINKIAIKNYVELKLNMPFEQFTENVGDIVIGAANDQIEKYEVKLDNKEVKSDVELIVTFLEADLDGEQTIKMRIIHKPSSTDIFIDKMETDGGDGDNFIEMFMSALPNTGKKIGKKIREIIRAANNAN